MSLLPSLLTPAQQTAIALQDGIEAMKRSILADLAFNVSTLEQSQDPQGTLDLLGAAASKPFAFFSAISTVAGQILTEAGDTDGLAQLLAIVARVPAHTVNEDGTVTLTPPAQTEVTE